MLTKPLFSLFALYAVKVDGQRETDSFFFEDGTDCPNDPGSDDHADRINLDTHTVMYSCHQGYQGVNFEGTVTLGCVDGIWQPYNPPSMSPVCILDDVTTSQTEMESTEVETTTEAACKDPGLVDNAERYFDHFNPGGLVYFNCKKDFCAKGMRTRIIEMECKNGEWTPGNKPTCVPCEACLPPPQAELEAKNIYMIMNYDFTAKVHCEDEYVIEAGTNRVDGTVDCIENSVWAPEIPVCSRKPQVVCGGNEITVIINKNMLDNLGFTGGIKSLAMTGLNADTEIIMKGCTPEIDDSGENYSFHIKSPYAGKCMTHFEHVKNDAFGNEANNYNFHNKIVWRQNSGAVMRSSTILDWTCEYEGLFTTGLDGPIKLALSTRTYIDKRVGMKQQEFTISMGIFTNSNFTNLLESSQVLHRGKRYFVALWLHEEEKGTPFLDRCYGSPNEISQSELIKMGRQPEPEILIRELIVDGCPAAVTLTKLEIPGSTYDRRWSFMYPYFQVDGMQGNYMYIHCDIKLRPTGFKPNCNRPNSAPAGALGGGLTDAAGKKLGKGQFFNREYGSSGEGDNFQYNQDKNMEQMQGFLKRKGLTNLLNSIGGYGNVVDKQTEQFNKDLNFQKETSLEALNTMNKDKPLIIQGKSSNGAPPPPDNKWEGFAGRKRRSVDDDYAVSIGPMVMIMDEDVDVADIKEITIQTKVPLKAMPDGTISVDESQPEAESYEFKYNTTYKSREDDIVNFKKLLPADRYVKNFDQFPGKIEWESQTQDEEDQLNDALQNIVAENIEEEIEEEEEEEAENFALKAICIIVGFLVGGAVLFALTLYVTMNSNLCLGTSSSGAGSKAAAKKVVGKANSAVPNVVVAGPDMKQMKDDEKQLNNSCGSSLTSAE